MYSTRSIAHSAGSFKGFTSFSMPPLLGQHCTSFPPVPVDRGRECLLNVMPGDLTSRPQTRSQGPVPDIPNVQLRTLEYH